MTDHPAGPAVRRRSAPTLRGSWPPGPSAMPVVLVLAVSSIVQADQLAVPGEFPTVQAAIDAAAAGDEVVVAAGTWTERIDTEGKAITIRSTDPADPAVVAATILDAGGTGSVVRIVSGEGFDTVLDGLTITGGDAPLGGGLEIALSSPTIRRCVIAGNQAGQGGGAYAYVSDAVFDRCRFEGNQATAGGAVYAASTGGLRLDACVLDGNLATDGAAIRNDGGTVWVRGGRIVGNQAADAGGAYFGRNGRLRLASTLVAGNTAVTGAAFRVEDDGVRARNATVVDNLASGENTGSVGSGFQAQLIFDNSIVRDNGPQPFDGWLNPLGRFSNIEGGAFGEGNLDADPLFVDPAAGDWRLGKGSPSIDAGTNGRVPGFDLRDADGTPRIQGAAVDQGAFEAAGAYEPPAWGPGRLVAAVRDDGAFAAGVAQPLFQVDEDEGTVTALVRHLPARAVAADPARGCLWVVAGDTGFLGRVPYDTLELEEIGPVRAADNPAASVSVAGIAVVGDLLYAVTADFGGASLLVIDPATARASEVATLPAGYQPTDLHHDAAEGRLLLLSNAGSLPSDFLGVVAIDLETLDLETIQPWENENPALEAPALAGLATGADRRFLFRAFYDDLEVYDAQANEQTAAFSLPGGPWVLGSLTWVEDQGDGPLPGDANGDGRADLSDLLVVLAHFGLAEGASRAEGDLDGDGDVDLADLLEVLAHFELG